MQILGIVLAILTTHPIQYQTPLWQALAKDGRVPFEVWYLTEHGVQASHDREFGQSFAWDLNLLEGYPHLFLRTAPGAAPGAFWKCRFAEEFGERLRTRKVTVLWVQGWQVAAYWQAVWAAHRAGVQVWLRGESNDLAPTPLWKRTVKRIVLGQLFRRVDQFLYIGTANRRLYENFGVPAAKLHPAPYAVDNARFAKQADECRMQNAEIRKQWNIPEDAFCVLFCGKFIPKKRPLDVVKALCILNAQPSTINYHALFVGSGELGGALRAACHVVFDADATVPFGPVVRSPVVPVDPTSDLRPLTSEAKPPASFPGFLNQTGISQAYVAADCLVLPSDYGETWGLVVNEAMASGLPCVISDRCGSAKDLGMIPPNQVYPCGNTTALADCLARLALPQERPIVPPESLAEYAFANSVKTVAEVWQLTTRAGSNSRDQSNQ